MQLTGAFADILTTRDFFGSRAFSSMAKPSTKTLLERAARVCSARGARLTPQRARALEVVLTADRPLTAYEILERMNEGGARPAPPTVYRALDFLLAQGLVHKLETLHAFVYCRHPEAPHDSQFFICNDCGEVDEVESSKVASSLAKAEAERGFHAERSVVEVVGTCADCTKRS